MWGFTVCDRVRLANEDLGFRIAIEAGIVLSEAERAAIEANGITVIGADALDRIPDLLSDCTVRWNGEGTPHFARRIIDGEEFVVYGYPMVESYYSLASKLKGDTTLPENVQNIINGIVDDDNAVGDDNIGMEGDDLWN